MKSVLSKLLPRAFLFAILSVGSSVWAQAIDKLPTNTSDGRAFTALTEKEVDALPDPDFDAYHKWRLRLKVTEYNKQKARADEAARLHAEAKARLAEEARLHAEAKARLAEEIRLRADLVRQTDELKLMNRILAHHQRYGNEINAERVQLQNELRNKSMMISNPIIEDFCNDYLLGNPINKHLPSLRSWYEKQ
jgi:hypothetical protein